LTCGVVSAASMADRAGQGNRAMEKIIFTNGLATRAAPRRFSRNREWAQPPRSRIGI